MYMGIGCLNGIMLSNSSTDVTVYEEKTILNLLLHLDQFAGRIENITRIT